MPGAIPPIAEMQIQLWLQLVQQKVPIPSTLETYHLLHSATSRVQYGVDYSTYQATLARDIGAAPSLGELWSQNGWFVTLTYWCVLHAVAPAWPISVSHASIDWYMMLRTDMSALERRSRHSTASWALTSPKKHHRSSRPSYGKQFDAEESREISSWV